MNKTTKIIKLVDEKIVIDVGMASVIAPAVAFSKPPPDASFKGIEADNPPCQTKNPVYAEAINSR